MDEAEQQKKRQEAWFYAQAKIALKYDLPVVIHTRNCAEKTLKHLEASGLKQFVIHCFSEDLAFAEKILTYSGEARISFTGILTYAKSASIQEVARNLPLDRIMIETDAPYLVPEPLR
jgi:TatD DNase family protein